MATRRLFCDEGRLGHSFWPLLNRGEPAVLFCFIWLYFAASGAGGAWSLDALYGRRHDD